MRDAFRDPMNIAMLDGIAEGLGAIGAGLLLLTDTGEAAGQHRRTRPMDAVVLIGCSPRLDASVAALRQRGIPLVAIEGDADATDVLDDRPRQPRGHARAAPSTCAISATSGSRS